MHAFMDTFGFLSLFIKTISLPCKCQWPYDWPQSQLKSNGMGFCFPCFLWLHQTVAKIKSFSVLSPFLLNSNKVVLSFLLGPFLNSFINETKNTRVFSWCLYAIYLIPEVHRLLLPRARIRGMHPYAQRIVWILDHWLSMFARGDCETFGWYPS